jgi:hypothetical protein
VEQLEGLSPQDLIPLQRIGPNARLLGKVCNFAARKRSVASGSEFCCRIITAHAPGSKL